MLLVLKIGIFPPAQLQFACPFYALMLFVGTAWSSLLSQSFQGEEEKVAGVLIFFSFKYGFFGNFPFLDQSLKTQTAAPQLATNSPTLITVALEKTFCMFDNSLHPNKSYHLLVCSEGIRQVSCIVPLWEETTWFDLCMKAFTNSWEWVWMGKKEKSVTVSYIELSLWSWFSLGCYYKI